MLFVNIKWMKMVNLSDRDVCSTAWDRKANLGENEMGVFEDMKLIMERGEIALLLQLRQV